MNCKEMLKPRIWVFVILIIFLLGSAAYGLLSVSSGDSLYLRLPFSVAVLQGASIPNTDRSPYMLWDGFIYSLIFLVIAYIILSVVFWKFSKK